MEDLRERSTPQPESEDQPGEAATEAAEEGARTPAAEAEPAVTPPSEPSASQQPAPDAGDMTPIEPVASAAGEKEETPTVADAEAPAPAEVAEAAPSVESAETSASQEAEAPAGQPAEAVVAAPTEQTAPTEEPPPAVAPTEEAPPAATSTEEAPPAVAPTEEAPPAVALTEEAPPPVAPTEEAAAEAPPTKPPAAAPAGPRLADLRPGMVMEGTVTRIERYGAFVKLGLAERRDGLIHISELSPYRIRRVEDVVKVGDSVRTRVVSVDLERGRIALSLNDVDTLDSMPQAAGAPDEPALTSMQLAFEQAYGRRREQEDREGLLPEREDVGARKRREHEKLMSRLRSDKP